MRVESFYVPTAGRAVPVFETCSCAANSRGGTGENFQFSPSHLPLPTNHVAHLRSILTKSLKYVVKAPLASL